MSPIHRQRPLVLCSFALGLALGAGCGTSVMDDSTCLASASCSALSEADAGGGAVNGAVCSADSDCTSGFCVRGLCCDSACSGDCQTCAAKEGAVADGTCSPAAGGWPCTADGNPCHHARCDGAGTCLQYDVSDGTACGSGMTCVAGACGPPVDAGTSCPAGQTLCGGTCTTCPTGGSCQGTACLCPSGEKDCGGMCNSCPSGGVCAGTSCTCPSGEAVCNGVCMPGGCSCPSGQTRCGNQCVDCPAGGVCAGSGCACPSGQTDCNGVCTTCPSGGVCSGNTCACPAGETDCGGVCVGCPTGGACAGTTCGCPSGEKLCAGACIPSGGCCTSAECTGATNSCSAGSCTCNGGPACAVGMTCSASGCGCGTGQLSCGGACEATLTACQDVACGACGANPACDGVATVDTASGDSVTCASVLPTCDASTPFQRLYSQGRVLACAKDDSVYVYSPSVHSPNCTSVFAPCTYLCSPTAGLSLFCDPDGTWRTPADTWVLGYCAGDAPLPAGWACP